MFYANNNFWPENEAYPGAQAQAEQGQTECDAKFESYVGEPFGQSVYSYTDIEPVTSDNWAVGDRGLECVAFYPSERAGGVMTIDYPIEGAQG